jgi:hypothetical protein
VTVSEVRRQHTSSRYTGVCWLKPISAWAARLWDPQTKCSRHIACYASEEDAARAYDCAAVQALGPGAKRNFPGEAISEAPVSRDGDRMGSKRPNSSSRYIGVCWYKAKSSWLAQIWDRQTGRRRRIGCFASEEDAAQAYDCAAVQAHGPGAKRNFPGEATSELPLTVGEERKQHNSSHYIGVAWSKSNSAS